MNAGTQRGRRGGVRRPPQACGRHASYFFSHTGIDIYLVEKYGIWLSYWYSTKPGIHCEPRAGRETEPSFDVRTLPYPFAVDAYKLSVDYVGAFVEMRSVHQATIKRAIDAGVWLDLLDPKFTLPRFAACPLRPARVRPDPTDEIPF
jgi:hypothetical protein